MWSLMILLLSVQASTGLAGKCYGKVIGDLVNRNVHGVAGKVRVADSKTIVVENFYYDGEAPDAFFWIGTSNSPDSTGTMIPVTEGLERKLDKYTGQTVRLNLPGVKTVQDYKWLSVWCRDFAANFGDITIPSDFKNPAPHNLNALPTFAHDVKADNVIIEDSETFTFVNLFYDGNGPDAYFYGGSHNDRGRLNSAGTKLIWKPGMTNAGSNQKFTRQGFNGETITVKTPPGFTVHDFTAIGLWCVAASQDFGSLAYDPSTLDVPCVLDEPPAYPNCEVLKEDTFQARWRINDDKINVELAGRVMPGNYLAFGRSGSDTRTLMDGSDVIVAYMDKQTMSPMVVDYNLQSKAQCGVNDGRGACPDTTESVGGENNVAFGDILFGNGIVRISYERDLNTSDPVDKVIPLDRPIYVSWAIGPINPDGRVAKHVMATIDDLQIDFGRASSTCPAFTEGATGPQLPPWPKTYISDTSTFRVDIGQSGGDRGYTGITGKVGWGIAWYMNGVLIPEISVKRGVTYTFEVYGGNNSENSAQYHPFYITDDNEGGYIQKTDLEKGRVSILAGPTEGPYCSWQEKESSVSADDFSNFADYKKNLERVCVGPSTGGGVLTWTPDDSTPDVVYYQCYTHRFLGWKIKVNSAAGTKISLLLLLVMLGLVSFI